MPFSLIDPGRRLDVFELRRADIKLPQLVAVLGLKAHGWGLAPQRTPVEAPLLQIMVDGRLFEEPFGRLNESLVGIGAASV